MILTLKTNDLLRFEEARGLTIEVLRGCAWLTETGRGRDSFLAEGARCRIAGDGVVLVGSRDLRAAELSLRLLAGTTRRGNSLLAGWLRQWRRRRTLQTLKGLDDHTLRDIGLSRGGFDAGILEQRWRERG